MTSPRPISTRTPIPPRRPALHFTPERNWINDPNGLVFHQGRYHLFFQHNPEGLDHGNISWGHASSVDLLRWDQHAVAIRYDESEQIFSGSVVVDTHNSSALGRKGIAPMVAIYTSARTDDVQAQSLAFSIDGGESWSKYANNPVLDRGSADFRNPKVFRYEGRSGSYWVLVAVEAVERRVLFYRSDDLIDWTYSSSYGPAGAVGGVWECPDLFPLPLDGDESRVRWVLIISVNPGGVAGGSGTQYVVGDFDGYRFHADETHPQVDALDPALRGLNWLDYGRDCYAGVTFNGTPADERVLMAWMGNWDYASALPAAQWRGAMTVARRLTLATIEGRPRLIAAPVLPRALGVIDVSELTISAPHQLGLMPYAARVDIDDIRGAITVVISDREHTVRVLLDAVAGVVQVDRRDARGGVTSDLFPSIETLRTSGGELGSVTLVLDQGSIEVFCAGQPSSLTDLLFLGEERTLSVESDEGASIGHLTMASLAEAPE